MDKKLRTSWDLSLILKDSSEIEINKLQEKAEKESRKFVKKWKHRKDYLENPFVLKSALDEYNLFLTQFGTFGAAWYFFTLKYYLNQSDPEIKAKLNKTIESSQKLQNETQFFQLKIAKISPSRHKQILSFKSLENYRHYIERLFENARFMLSDPEERIMNLKTNTSYSNWVKMLQSFLTKEERKTLDVSGQLQNKSFSEVLSLTNHQNKKVRSSAAKAFNDILLKHLSVAENEINSVLQNKKADDELRGYKRPDEERHITDDIETEVVDTLIKVVTKNFDIAHRFYKLKAELFKQPKIKYYERSALYGKTKREFTFQESVNLVSKVFGNLDSEFQAIFLDFTKNGKVDVFPKNGKYSGAFAIQSLLTLPSFVLLNWSNQLSDVKTLAHEFGHIINYELMRKRQNAINFDTPLSVTEVASTFMEDFVLDELNKNADEDFKLVLSMAKLNDDVASIFRQVACYNFEFELHTAFRNKGYLSATEIGLLFRNHMSSYLGNYVDLTGSENWWVYWQHIRSYFYNYSYANGLLISKSLQSSVKKNPRFILKVKEFLSAGLSDSPKNIFTKLGVDITDRKFWEKGLKEVESLLEETEALARKLKKI